MSTTRHVLLTALLLGACTDGVARESVPAEAEPEPTAAVVTIDGRDQYALLGDIEGTQGNALARDGAAMGRVRAAWQGVRVRWEAAFVAPLCRDAGSCHLAPFDHARVTDHRIQQGWMPQLELDDAGVAALARQCAPHPGCVVEFEATLREFVFDPEHATALRFADVAVLGTRAARADESWLATPGRPRGRT